MAANIELLDEILLLIEENEQDWNQYFYAWASGENPTITESNVEPGPECETAFCVAGHVAKKFKAKFVWKVYFDGHLSAINIINSDGRYQGIEDFARDKLGLTPPQAMSLFAEENTLEDLKRMRDNLANGRDIEFVKENE